MSPDTMTYLSIAITNIPNLRLSIKHHHLSSNPSKYPPP